MKHLGLLGHSYMENTFDEPPTTEGTLEGLRNDIKDLQKRVRELEMWRLETRKDARRTERSRVRVFEGRH